MAQIRAVVEDIPPGAAKTGALGNRLVMEAVAREAATFQFPNGVVSSYSANQITTGGFQDIGEMFICEKGAIYTSRLGYKLYHGKKRGDPPVEVVTKGDITMDAVNAFVDGARTGKLENAAFHAAESTLTEIMAREAIYSGKEMTWDTISVA